MLFVVAFHRPSIRQALCHRVWACEVTHRQVNRGTTCIYGRRTKPCSLSSAVYEELSTQIFRRLTLSFLISVTSQQVTLSFPVLPHNHLSQNGHARGAGSCAVYAQTLGAQASPELGIIFIKVRESGCYLNFPCELSLGRQTASHKIPVCCTAASDVFCWCKGWKPRSIVPGLAVSSHLGTSSLLSPSLTLVSAEPNLPWAVRGSEGRAGPCVHGGPAASY